MILPDSFFQGHSRLLVHIEKESKFFTLDRDNLQGFNATDNTVQEIVLPINPPEKNQGYWGAPTYWKWTSGGSNDLRGLWLGPGCGEPKRASS